MIFLRAYIKAGPAEGIILRQPGRLDFQDPLLSVPSSRRVWLLSERTVICMNNDGSSFDIGRRFSGIVRAELVVVNAGRFMTVSPYSAPESLLATHTVSLIKQESRTCPREFILRQPGRLVFQDPLLSVPSSRRVWLCIGRHQLYIFIAKN